MVRLVFRPYTHVWRSICTSEPLRSSTRVSSGFNLHKHRSPSFGSQHVRSCSASFQKKNYAGRWCAFPPKFPGSHLSLCNIDFYFHCASRFRKTLRLAHMLHSLVRVSRRVGWVTYFDTADYCRTRPITLINNNAKQTIFSHTIRVINQHNNASVLRHLQWPARFVSKAITYEPEGTHYLPLDDKPADHRSQLWHQENAYSN